MNQIENEVLQRSTAFMDALYDSEMGLIRADWVNDACGHDVRGSSHYAVGLLARGTKEDISRGEKVIRTILANRMLAPGEIYHATFKRDVTEPLPPAGVYPWRDVSPDCRALGDRIIDRTANSFFAALEKEGMPASEIVRMETLYWKALCKNFPVTWKTYDPNWREFIASAFAVILALFEEKLSAELIEEMEDAMKLCVSASIDRQKAGLSPMNTNIELMHIFICDYYGTRFQMAEVQQHAQAVLADFYRNYQEFHAIAEYNSPTYCGVDLYALALLRAFGSTEEVRKQGTALEEGLWEDIAKFYNPSLDQISGPFSRCYEMDLNIHTSMPTLLYLALGSEHREYPVDNCETSYNPILALSGIRIPPSIVPSLLAHTEDRQVCTRFRELNERETGDSNHSVCTATAWIASGIMLGALSGSRNLSGQLHPATVYWAHEGNLMSLRIRRRYPGHDSMDAIRTVYFDAKVQKQTMEIDVHIDTERNVEIYFEIIGEGIDPNHLSASKWRLPGLQVDLSGNMPAPQIIPTTDGAEVIFSAQPACGENSMSFRLECEVR